MTARSASWTATSTASSATTPARPHSHPRTGELGRDQRREVDPAPAAYRSRPRFRVSVSGDLKLLAEAVELRAGPVVVGDVVDAVVIGDIEDVR